MPPPMILRRLQGGRVRRRADGGGTPDIDALKQQAIAAYRSGDLKGAQQLADQIVKLQASTAPAPEIGVGEDLARSAGRGAIRGALNIPGLPGNMVEAGSAANRALGLQPPQDAGGQEFTREMVGTQPLASFTPPTTDTLVKNALPKPLTDAANYEPRSPLGKGLDAGLELAAPSGVLSGATKIPKMISAGVKLGFIPGAAGEAASELDPDEGSKPLVRFGANVLGAGVASGVSNAIRAPGAANRAVKDFADLPATVPGAAAGPGATAVSAAVGRLKGGFNYTTNPAQLSDDVEILRKAGYDVDSGAPLAKVLAQGPVKAPTPASATVDPAMQAKVNQIKQAVARTVGAGKPGSQAEQYRKAFTSLDTQLNMADAKGSSMSQLFTPEERDIIRQLASGDTASWLTDKASKLTGLRPFIAALVGGGISTGFAVHGFSDLTHLGEMAPAALATGAAASAAGRLARANEGVSQGDAIKQLAGLVTGNKPSIAGRATPNVFGGYAVTPPPPDMEDRYPE